MNWLRLFLLALSFFFGWFHMARATVIPDRPKDARGMLKWEYDAVDQADTDPGIGKMKFNVALPLLENSTELYIDNVASGQISVDSVLRRLTTGDFFYVQSEYKPGASIMFRVMSTAVDRTGFYRLSVEAHGVGVGALFADGDTVICQLFFYDDSGGGSDTTAKYLSQDFSTGEWVTYVPSQNAFLPWNDDTVKIGLGLVPFAEGYIRYVEAGDSLESPVLVGTYRTLGIWFWKGRQGTDSLQLGVDTVNQWILACDGQGNCIPLTRDSLLGSTLDSVFKYMDANGGALSDPNARVLDSVARDVFLLKGNSPRFKVTSDSTLEVAGRIVTMIGDTTWGIGIIDFKSHLVFHFLDTTGTDSIITYQLSDTINGRLGNNWALTVDSTSSGTTQRLVFEPQVGGGGSGTFSDSSLYVVDARGTGVLVGKWVSGKWEWKNDTTGVQMVTVGSTTDDITLKGKNITAIGDTTYKVGHVAINGHLYFTYIDTSTAPDSVRFLEMADTSDGFYTDGWVWTIDDGGTKAVWAAPAGGPGGSGTLLRITGQAASDSGILVGLHGILVTYNSEIGTPDTFNVALDTTVTAFRKFFDSSAVNDTMALFLRLAGGTMATNAAILMSGGTIQQVDTLLGENGTNVLVIGSTISNSEGFIKIGAHGASGSDSILFAGRAAGADVRVFYLSGDRDSISAESHRITNVSNPTAAQDAATKDWTENAIDDSLATYLQGNQTITLSGDASGSGATAITVAVADDSHNHGTSSITDGSLAPVDMDEGTAAADGDVATRGSADTDFDWEAPGGAGRLLRASAGLGLYNWTFLTATTDTDPGAGAMKMNNAAVGSVTFLYVDTITFMGINLSDSIYPWVSAGDVIHLFDVNNPSNAVFYRLSGTITVAGGIGYWKIPVTFIDSSTSGQFGASDTIAALIQSSPEPGQVYGIRLGATTGAADYAYFSSTEWVGSAAYSFNLGSGSVPWGAGFMNSLTLDLAGSGQIKLPSGQNRNPSLKNEILIDTNDFAISMTDGTNDYYIAQRTRMFSVTFDNPQLLANDSVIIMPIPSGQFPAGIALLELGLTSRDDATDSVWFAEWTEPEADVGTESQIDTLTQAGATEVSSTSFSDNALTAGSYLVAIFKLASGQPITIWGRYRVILNN